jgi:hypothetical protein
MSAPPECCIAGADGQPWPCRSAWLLRSEGGASPTFDGDFRFEAKRRLLTFSSSEAEQADRGAGARLLLTRAMQASRRSGPADFSESSGAA